MENLFQGKTSMRIPKNLDECNEWDETAISLELWAERTIKIGSIVGGIIAILGIIVTLTETVAAAEMYSEALPAIGVFLTSILTWGLYAVIEVLVYNSVALLLKALANITQSSVVSARVALFEVSQNNATAQEAEATKPSSTWQCKYCNTTNKETDIQCVSCGEFRASSTRAVPSADNSWQCVNCGTMNKASYGQCKKCGQYRK